MLGQKLGIFFTTIIRSKTSWPLKARILPNLIILTAEDYRQVSKTPWKRNLEAIGLLWDVRLMNIAVLPILANMYCLRLLMANLFGFILQNIKVKIFWEGHKIWKSLPVILTFTQFKVKTRRKFFNFLWPFQKT